MKVLSTIIISQFFCTSMWFAGNAVMPEIAGQLQLDPAYLIHLSSVVQFGFITGTLVFAVLGIADRYSPSRIFLCCALIAALLNSFVALYGLTIDGLLISRFFVGFFLAGIYPVGMKIAADHFDKGLGKSLSFLVGALALGTSFPHFLKFATAGLPWKYVMFSTSLLAITGGIAMASLVPDGPYRTKSQQFRWSGFLDGFSIPGFRAAAFGYFGHMWELYAFWVFVPVFLAMWQSEHTDAALNIPLLSFLIIAAGSAACVCGGYLSERFGVKMTAAAALMLSCLCCFLFPVFITVNSSVIFISFLFFWSMTVIADSPLFSTLVAQSAPPGSKGSALTVVTCIGFAVTIVSIQLVGAFKTELNSHVIYMLLGVGPVLGLIALKKKKHSLQDLSTNE